MGTASERDLMMVDRIAAVQKQQVAATPDLTVIVADSPISNPSDRIVSHYEFHGSLTAVRKITIAVSHEVELPVLLAQLQSMWDRRA